MIRFLIFDLDGTLIDSAPDIIWVANELLKSRGREALSEVRVKAAIGHGMRALITNLFGYSDDSLERDYHELYKNHLTVRTRVYPGVDEFLAKWPHKAAIATNKLEDLALGTVAQLSLAKREWVKIYGSNSLPEKKPHPLPLLECMRAAGVTADETLMIGDGIPDMEAARAAGVRGIGISFGYTDPEKLRQAGASAMLTSYVDLAEIIRALDA